MTISEVFPNATVKQVIFQIRFPNLFYIENRIGDFQVKIMSEFPESRLLHRRQILLAEIGDEVKLEGTSQDATDKSLKKIWQFSSPKNYQLNVLSDSLDITSAFHKTYSNPQSQNKFRDVIDFVLKNFFDVTDLPIVNRLGLRYIDECPIPSKDNETFRLYYNTGFPLERFDISKAQEMEFKTVIERDACLLRYVESLQHTEKGSVLILDFDGYATKVAPRDCLEVTDKLHKVISDEYEKTIREPVYNYMRTTQEGQT
jgi:uncharacterized protein (TIGR04255 family)